jgi:hypothetical protein
MMTANFRVYRCLSCALTSTLRPPWSIRVCLCEIHNLRLLPDRVRNEFGTSTGIIYTARSSSSNLLLGFCSSKAFIAFFCISLYYIPASGEAHNATSELGNLETWSIKDIETKDRLAPVWPTLQMVRLSGIPDCIICQYSRALPHFGG